MLHGGADDASGADALDAKHGARRRALWLGHVAKCGATAAWALGRWAEMHDFVDAMEDDDAGKPFYRAVLALRPGAAADPARAVELVDEARRLLHPAFAALVGESYKRARGGRADASFARSRARGRARARGRERQRSRRRRAGTGRW